MFIEVNRICSPVSTLGPGKRLGLWLQGCDIQCAGCVSKDTWQRGLGQYLKVTDLAELVIQTVNTEQLDGISITGGEPTLQGNALVELLRLVKIDCSPSFDVAIFTGLAERDLIESWPSLTREADVFICGPYVKELSNAGSLLASKNQTFYFPNGCTEEYRQSFEEVNNQLQTSVANGDITFAGIPRPGDMQIIEQMLIDRGVVLGETSWENC